MGLSQAKLGDLVGRSASTVRGWESDSATPGDPDVLDALAAVLGLDARMLYEKAGMPLPAVEESPTVEQALATLRPEPAGPIEQAEPEVVPMPGPSVSAAASAGMEVAGKAAPEVQTDSLGSNRPPVRSDPQEPRFISTSETFLLSPPSPPIAEPSYIEDSSQRQLYRVRNLATIVLLVALVVVFLWAFSNALSALGQWWDDFFGGLRL